MTTKEKLVEILETFCPEDVYLQGTLNTEKAYPRKFITYFTSDSNFDEFYDDNSNNINWYISVIFYSSNPAEMLTIPFQILSALKNAGFIPENAGIDVISDKKTHTGWAMDFIYREKISN